MKAAKLEAKPQLTRYLARERLNKFRRYVGTALIASAFFGVYLLSTDRSLWLLATSHAYGLIAICLIDFVLGVTNLISDTDKLLLPTAGWGIMTVMLQLGDIATAPQYKMTSQYFARYLFTLPGYDALLLTQGVIVALVFCSRSYQRLAAKKKAVTFFDMGLNRSRRDFLQISGAIGALLALAAVLGVASAFSTRNDSPPTSQTVGSTQQVNSLPNGAVANINQLQVGTPFYFDYPSGGYPNMIIKKSDGSLTALSMLCTHVCCQCEYISNSSEIECPCHGSVFDLNGHVLRGPATVPLPSVELKVDTSGNIYVVKLNSSSACV